MEPIKVKTMDELVEERKRERESSLDEMHFWFIVCTVLFSFAILWVGFRYGSTRTLHDPNQQSTTNVSTFHRQRSQSTPQMETDIMYIEMLMRTVMGSSIMRTENRTRKRN